MKYTLTNSGSIKAALSLKTITALILLNSVFWGIVLKITLLIQKVMSTFNEVK